MITLYTSTTTGETCAVQTHGDGTHTASDWLHHEEVDALTANPLLLATIDCDNAWTEADFECMVEVKTEAAHA